MLEGLALFDLFSIGILSTPSLSLSKLPRLTFHQGDDQFHEHWNLHPLLYPQITQIRYLARLYSSLLELASGSTSSDRAGARYNSFYTCNYQQVCRTLHPFAFSSKHPADSRYLSGNRSKSTKLPGMPIVGESCSSSREKGKKDVLQPAELSTANLGSWRDANGPDYLVMWLKVADTAKEIGPCFRSV